MSKMPDLDHFYAQAASGTAIVGTMLGHLPTVAAIIGAGWYAIQIWETDTVRGWTNRTEETTKPPDPPPIT